MRTLLFIINLCLTLYSSSPIFTTYDQLPEDRHGQVYVVVHVGIVLDEAGNGRLIGPHVDPVYNYISYRDVKDAEPGDLIYTFDIMNPESNYCDDIIYRYDVIHGQE